jgi:hypothetical protein
VRTTPHFEPVVVLFGREFYKYTCCEWPQGKEPDLGGGGAVIAIIIGCVIGVVAIICGIVACVFCCAKSQGQTTVIVHQVEAPMQPMQQQNVPQVVPMATIPAPAGSFCPWCGASGAVGSFCSGCGRALD